MPSLKAIRAGTIGFSSTGISDNLQYSNVTVLFGQSSRVLTLPSGKFRWGDCFIVEGSASDPGTVNLGGLEVIDGVNYYTQVSYAAPAGSTSNFRIIQLYPNISST
jgi:hypothetical protein